MEDEIITDAPEVPEGGQTEEVKTTSTESGDPLDAISDPDELRKIAKSRGVAYKRVKEERDELKTNLAPTDPLHKPVTKQDLLVQNTQEAKNRVSEDIRANWKVLQDYVPVKYHGATSPDDIAKAMTVAYTTYLAENPAKAGDPGAALATDAGIKGGSQTVAANAAPTEDPRFGKPKGPESWYQEKK